MTMHQAFGSLAAAALVALAAPAQAHRPRPARHQAPAR